jgi:3-dehydroquinate synthase class II
MPTTLKLHFDTAPGTDANALAAELQSGLAALPDVERAGAQPIASRDLGATEMAIMGFLTVAPVMLTKAADIIDALKRIVQSSEGLRNAVVEIRGRRVPVAELQPSDIVTTAAAPAGPAS